MRKSESSNYLETVDMVIISINSKTLKISYEGQVYSNFN